MWGIFTSWLGIDSNRHHSWIVSNLTKLLHRSNVTMEYKDGYMDDIGKANPDMVTIACSISNQVFVISTGANLA